MEGGRRESLNEMLHRMYTGLSEEQIQDIESKIIEADAAYNSGVTISSVLDIPFVNKSNNPNPEYETDGASGFDLRANILDEPITLQPLERKLIPTGLFYALPEGYELQVRPRSGLAYKFGITVLNAPGTIDADYRGEVGVLLINLGELPFTINHGDRIAQGVFAPSAGGTFYRPTQKETLDETERGTKGFGSTGIQ